MANDFGQTHASVVGSGTVPFLRSNKRVAEAIPEGYAPDKNTSLDLVQYGPGVAIINPENFSLFLGLRQDSISVGTSAVPLPDNPLEGRRALVVHNFGSETVYLGNASVTTSDGMPLLAGEKMAFDMQGNEQARLFAISAGTVDVRILELS